MNLGKVEVLDKKIGELNHFQALTNLQYWLIKELDKKNSTGSLLCIFCFAFSQFQIYLILGLIYRIEL